MPGLVVVGASLAGLRAVEAARRAKFSGPVTLIGAEDHLPYDRPPLSKAFLESTERPEAPTFRTRESFTDELGVELRLGASATALDVRGRVVLVEGTAVHYDALVIATGAHARTLPGCEAMAGVHTLRTLDDARAVRSAFVAGARLVVIGGGFIGSEVASSAREHGLDVTVVEALPAPLSRALGPTMGQACGALHAAHGTKLLCGIGVAGLEGGASVRTVRLLDGSTLAADLVVLGIGALPATGWLSGSGLTLQDGVVCDETLYAGAPGVYAAGDVVRWYNSLFGSCMRLEHWTSAAEQGALAARNALNPMAATSYATVPYFWSDWYGSRIQFVGVPECDEVETVLGHPETARFVTLYRRDERLVAALALNGQAEIMKYRALIAQRASWAEACAFARSRRERYRSDIGVDARTGFADKDRR